MRQKKGGIGAEPLARVQARGLVFRPEGRAQRVPIHEAILVAFHVGADDANASRGESVAAVKPLLLVRLDRLFPFDNTTDPKGHAT
jgi:hypothetical protein